MIEVAWPGGLRCAVAITVDSDGTANEVGRGMAPTGSRSHGRYSRHGIARYLDLFDKHGISGTFFTCGWDAEQSPQIFEAVVAGGHEVAAHGYQHEMQPLGDAEPALLRKTHGILTAICGSPPVGFRSPGGIKTALTVRTLIELGYLYDSSEKDFDLPYIGSFEGRQYDKFAILPNNTSSLDDFPFYRVSYTPPSEVLAHWKQEFDAIYREGGYFNLTLHPRLGFGSGAPSRAAIVGELIAYIGGHDGVGFFRMRDIAQWCLSSPAKWRIEEMTR
ncbi:polysaccharide deacetylase family protein [Burkholderia multivorans]|uniref:polysaccharide deacetylase family protein n=1 Tax=Burkholderia multivorans TaxID=87883 RepID=UPI001C21B902|nr:polysaccharide deacetylase family protein [Burkholderia multivorans]MBU9185752.1 polysaccharide deacetylase family protein [Burkholderia multivorans]MBU9284117.1 polysaccharide deacetylase family protein [Burkholderia multivorans]MBU9420750.1 polysaccharide deacetylase family protein [Burkholderia multivorans]MDN7451284.1 polysaccharide deacetylase family protein [Burkholderia multivorans]